MGCMCSLPSVVDCEKRESSGKSLNSTFASSKSMFRRKQGDRDRESMDQGMSVMEVMQQCSEAVEQNFNGDLDPVMIAAIVLMESSGIPDLNRFRDDFQDTAYGLGQMLFTTAEFLIKSGYVAYRPERAEDLYNPSVSLYFVCAYVDYLSKHTATGSCEEFVVKGYHSGSRRMEEAPSHVWDIYLKAHSQLSRLQSAMASSQTEPIIHVVQPGENLEVIGRICGVSAQAIMEVNPDVKDMELIQSGDCIEIPVHKLLPRLYAVKANESVASIARKHDISLFRLLSANPDIKNPSALKPGWVLSIPGLKGSSVEGHVRSDLISTGIEDGPFFHSSFADRYALRMEEDMIAGAAVREHLRNSAYSRSAVRRLLKRNSPK